MTYPTPQDTPPFGVRRLAWWTCTPSHMQTRSSKTRSPTPHLGPATTPSSPISPWLSPSPRSPCLIYAFAEQLLPRELREQHSHLSTLVTRCHLLLPAHRTSRQTMPRAFWTSDLLRLPQRGLGGALDSESHGWWSSKPRPQWHLQLVHTHLKWKKHPFVPLISKDRLERREPIKDEISLQNGWQRVDFYTRKLLLFIFTKHLIQTCARNFECLPVFFPYPKYVWAAQRSESCGEMLSDNPDVASDTCNRSAAVTLRVSNLCSERETATLRALHCTHRDTRRRPSRRSRSET